MPQKNIYIRDADKALWDEAEELAGSASFSQLITDLLRDQVAQQKRKKEALSMEMETIEFEVENEDTGRISKKSFKGQWVIGFNDPVFPEGWMGGHCAVAAITAKGAIFIGNYKQADGDQLHGYTIYKSLEEAEAANEPAEVLAAVAEELGEDFVEEFDI